MTSLADRTVAALRSTHDELAALVPGLTDEQLSTTSGAAEWTIAQVLSHLGSGAEIAQAGLVAALGGETPPGQDVNQAVWARWDALAPDQQAAAFLRSDAELLDVLESLSSDHRENLEMELGFLPAPLPFSAVAGLRLSEAAQHSWDARVGLDGSATVDPASAAVLLEQYAGGLGFMLGFAGRADTLEQPAVVLVEGSDLALTIEERASLGRPSVEPTATLVAEPEAVVRLLGGRLTPAHTPAGVAVTGNVSLDDLRAVFPGY